MLRYALNRILTLIPVIFLVSVAAFSFWHLLPGDVIDVLAGEEDIEDPEVRAALEKEPLAHLLPIKVCKENQLENLRLLYMG